MSSVLVLAEHAGGRVARATLEMVTLARRMGDVDVVWLGSGASDGQPSLQAAGVRSVRVAEEFPVDSTPAGVVAALLQAQVSAVGADSVLVSSTITGKEIAGRLAARLRCGLITDASDLSADRQVTQSIFGGSLIVQSRIPAAMGVVTVRPNAVQPEETSGTAEIVAIDFTPEGDVRTANVVDRSPIVKSDRPELTEASIVVSGGRGMAAGENFALVEELADSMGAAVGASRAATDAGWYPHQFQVGQTGKTVSPQLYMANGISGAIQHRAGMQTSKVVVAVNKDAEAPIFELADFGVVGDLFTVIPQLMEQIRARAE